MARRTSLLATLCLLWLALCLPAFGQNPFDEGFESGTCEETWGGSCPTTVTNAPTMTGSWFLSRSNTSDHIVESGLTGTDERWFQFQLRRDAAAGDFIHSINSGTNGVCQVQMDSSNGSLRMDNSGGTDSNSISFPVDTNKTFDVYAKKCTTCPTTPNAQCWISDDGGATWQKSANGTWIGQIDRHQLEGAAGVVLGWDEIKRCDLGPVGQGACDAPSRNRFWAHFPSSLAIAEPSAAPPPDPPGPPEPWERAFTPARKHFVSPSGQGTADGLTKANAESFATARGHAQAGDEHELIGGTYPGSFTFTADGTSSNPIVWRGFVDANGDPENVVIDGKWTFAGDWTWAWALHFGDLDNSESGQAALALEARGTAIINSIIQDHVEHSGLDMFNFGPDMVAYGVILINNGKDDTGGPPPHNVYTQNANSNGWKYYIQFLTLDHFDSSHFNIHAFGTNGPVQKMHFEDGVVQRGRSVFRRQNYATDGYVFDIVFKNMLADSLTQSSMFEIGGIFYTPAQFEVTGNLFRNTQVQLLSHLGVGDTCISGGYPPASKFNNNRVLSPNGGLYAIVRTSHVVPTGEPPTCQTESFGNAKIRDVDEWDNNTYGPSGTFDLHCNGVDYGGTLNLTDWRNNSDSCRETAGGVAFDLNSSIVSLPTVDEVRCYDNFYEAGWGYCWGIDWDGGGSVSLSGAEVDKVIANGKTYTVRNVRDFYGTPLKTGTYTAGAGIASVSLPGDAVNDVLLVWITSQP